MVPIHSALGLVGYDIIYKRFCTLLPQQCQQLQFPIFHQHGYLKYTAEVKKQIAQRNKSHHVDPYSQCRWNEYSCSSDYSSNFPQKETVVLASTLLTFGSPAIVFYGLSTYTNGLLQALGYSSIPLKNAIYALIIHCFITLFLLLATNLNIYSLLIGNCLYGLQLCFANQRALKHITTYYQEKLHTFIYMYSSVICDFTVALCYYGLIKVIDRLIITLFIAIVIGVIIYFGTLLFLYKDNVEELSQIPYLQKS